MNDTDIYRKLCGEKIVRRVSIAKVFLDGEGLTPQQIIDRFGVSRQTATRDLSALRVHGLARYFINQPKHL